MAALQYVDVPGYSALLLRRTYAQLSMAEGLMDRAHEWLGPTDAEWQDQTKTWQFPSGARLSFGYLESKNDRFRYQSSAFQFIAFDELTDFEERDYRFLFSRLRRLEKSHVPLRMRAASNPGGPGHDWVRRRFIEGAPSYDEEGRPVRIFVPSRLEDNPSLDAKAYEESLEQLDPVTRQQLRWGDWDVTPEGGMFRREDFRIVAGIPLPQRARAQVVRYWDLAATEGDADWTRGVKLARTQDGLYYVLDVAGCREAPAGVEALLRRTAEADGRDVPIYVEQEPGASGKAYVSYLARHVLPEFEFRAVPSSGSKEVRARAIAGQVALGHVALVEGGNWIAAFLDEVCAFPTEGVHDDQVDALSGAFGVLSRRPLSGQGSAQVAVSARDLRRAARRQ